jgi:hypothetical protein
MDSEPPDPQAGAQTDGDGTRPVAAEPPGAGAAEIYGPISLVRLLKGDGRALILFSESPRGAEQA